MKTLSYNISYGTLIGLENSTQLISIANFSSLLVYDYSTDIPISEIKF